MSRKELVSSLERDANQYADSCIGELLVQAAEVIVSLRHRASGLVSNTEDLLH